MWGTKMKQTNSASMAFSWEGNCGDDGLPEEVLERILQRLDVRSLASASLVCRRWYRVQDDDRLWKDHISVVAQRRGIIPIIGSTGLSDSQPEMWAERSDDDASEEGELETRRTLRRSAPLGRSKTSENEKLRRSDARELMRALHDARSPFADGIDVYVIGSRTHGMHFAIVNSFLSLLDPEASAIGSARVRAKKDSEARSASVDSGKSVRIDSSQVTVFFGGLLYRFHFSDWWDAAQRKNELTLPRPKIVLFPFQLSDVGRTTAASTCQALASTLRTIAFYDRLVREDATYILIGFNPINQPCSEVDLESGSALKEALDEEERIGKGKEAADEELSIYAEDHGSLVAGNPANYLRRFVWVDEKLLQATMPSNPPAGGAPALTLSESVLTFPSDSTNEHDEEVGLGIQDQPIKSIALRTLGVSMDNPAAAATIKWARSAGPNSWIQMHGYAEVDWDVENGLISEPTQLISHMILKSEERQAAAYSGEDLDAMKKRFNLRQYGSLWYFLLHVLEGILCGLLIPVAFCVAILVVLAAGIVALATSVPRILGNSRQIIILRFLMLLWAIISVTFCFLALTFVAVTGILTTWAWIAITLRTGYRYGLRGAVRMAASMLKRECYDNPQRWLMGCWCL